MLIGIFGRHPIPQPGFMGVMSFFEAIYLSRQGHEVELILPFKDAEVYRAFLKQHRLADLNELEKAHGFFEIIPLLEGEHLSRHYDAIIYQSYEFSDYGTFFPVLRAAATVMTKNFPKFVPSATLALHESVESAFKTFDLVACALKDDVADLRMNRRFWDKYGHKVAYVPRGADPTLLHPGRKPGGRPTIGIEIPFNTESLDAIAFYIEPIRRLQQEIPNLRVVTLGAFPHPDIKSDHVYFGRFDTIYDKFFNEIWLYLIMDYRKSAAHVSAPVQTLHPRDWSARAIYEVQNIEAQMSGAIIIGHPDNTISELLRPGSSALYFKDYSDTDEITSTLRSGILQFATNSQISREWAYDNFRWEHCMELWSAALEPAVAMSPS